MEKQPNNTFVHDHHRHFETVIGDEKQNDFFPRIKIKKWQNDVNYSVGIKNPPDGAKVTTKGDKVTWSKGGVSANFYPISKRAPKKSAYLRFLPLGEITSPAAEFEFSNVLGIPALTLTTFETSEPTLVCAVNKDVRKYFDPAAVKIKKERVGLGNFNPYYADKGIVLVDLHTKGYEFDGKHVGPAWQAAMISTFARHNITLSPLKPGKLFFKDGDKDVKISSFAFYSNRFTAYIVLDNDYNKAFDYYNNGTKPNDPFAYGIRKLYPDLPDSIIGEVVTDFSANLKLDLKPDNPTQDELEYLQKTTYDESWLLEAKRNDVGWDGFEPEEGFEFDIVLDKKPASNIIELTTTTKNLELHKQDPLSIEEIHNGAWQPSGVVGSYAAYHTSEVNNDYETGKAFHIYRPVVIDANRKKIHADLNVDTDKEILQVILPQDFIDTASYPIIIDPFFGYNAIGSSTVDFLDTILATAFTSLSTGNGQFISSIAAYIDMTNAQTASISGAIYNTSGNSQLEATTNSTSITASAGFAAWQILRMYNKYHQLSTVYNLAIWGTNGGYNTPNATIAYDATGTASGFTSYSLSSTYTANWPFDLSGKSTQSNRRYSIYAFTGYQFPIMVNNITTISTASEVFSPINSNADNVWATTQPQVETPAPGAYDFSDFKFKLNVAPGGANQRSLTLYQNETTVLFQYPDIAGTDTTIVDTTSLYRFAQGDTFTISMNTGTTPAASAAKWRGVQTTKQQFLFAATNGGPSTSLTSFMGVDDQSFSTANTTAIQVAPETGTLGQLWGRMGSTLSSGSYKVSLTINGTQSTICTVTLDSTHQSRLQTSGSTETITQGDNFYYTVTPTTPNASKNLELGIAYTSSTAGNGILLSSNDGNAATNATTYNGWHGNTVWRTVESNAQVLGASMWITKIFVKIGTATGAGKSRTITFRINSVDTAATVTISSASVLTGMWTGRVKINDDDLIDVAHSSSGTPTASNVRYSIVFTTIPQTHIGPSDTGTLGSTMSMLRLG